MDKKIIIKKAEERHALKQALKSEVSPLLIGLRNEIKDLRKQVTKLISKEFPEIQTVHEIDQKEFPKDFSVNNFPKEIEISNQRKEVEVKGFKSSFKALLGGINPIGKQLENITGLIRSNFTKLSDTVYKVKIENHKEIKFPDIQKVQIELTQELIKLLKQAEVQRVHIENSSPKEAIPVILADKDRKRFYDLMVQVVGGGGGNSTKGSLGSILSVLNQIENNTDGLEITLGDIDLNTDTLEALIATTNSELVAIKGFVDGVEALLTSIDGKDFATETTLSAISGFVDGIEGLLTSLDGKDFATETTLAKIKAQTALLTFIGDRLKVDAEVVIMAEPRPGKRIAEFLKESGGSPDLNIDGSSTPVTFSAAPPTGKKWFIHSISLVMEDASINFTKFGGITGGLTNGLEVKVKEGGLAEALLGNFKRNGDFFIFTTGVKLESASLDILTIEVNIKVETGTTFELADANSEIFKAIVNDDLTTIGKFNILIRGFEEDE